MRRYELQRNSGLLLALCAGLLLLSACTLVEGGEETQPQGAYKVYYAVTGEQATVQVVDWEYRVPTGEDTASALAELVLSQPETAGLASPAPSGTRLLSCQQEDGQLRLDLSEQYGGLSGVDLTVANSCLTLTLCQLEGVEEVYITVEGEPIPYQTLRAMGADDVLLPGTGETELTVSVGLCFPRADGGGLGIEYRDVVQNEGDTMASTVFTALLEGPRYQELTSLMPEGTKLRGISVQGGVCTVNLSSEFMAGLPKEEQAARLLLYSIVDTLCMQEKLSISTVQILSDGHAIESIGGVPASMPLEPDWTLLES